jgi:hypothetical protein
LSNSFPASVKMIMWFLSLLLFMCFITFIDLCVLNHPYIPGMKSAWSWCMIFWYVVELGLPVFYWEFLHLSSLKTLAYPLSFFFFSCVIVWFWDEYNTDFIERVWQHSFPFFHGKVWGMFEISSLKVWFDSTVNPSGSGLFFLVDYLLLL